MCTESGNIVNHKNTSVDPFIPGIEVNDAYHDGEGPR